MPKYIIGKKVNMFTTAAGTDVPVLEQVTTAKSVPDAADRLIAYVSGNGAIKPEVPKDTYFILELQE